MRDSLAPTGGHHESRDSDNDQYQHAQTSSAPSGVCLEARACAGNVQLDPLVTRPWRFGVDSVSLMRDQLRMIVCGVVLVVIAIASIIEPPGVIEGIGYALVIAAMLIVIQRARKRLRR